MTEYDDKITPFLERLNNSGIKKIIAFSGSCPKDLEAAAEQIVRDSFSVLSKLPVAIQTGGTDFDVQRYAAAQARAYGMPLIGIFPSKGAKYRINDLDFALEVSPRWGESVWGDDSELFAKFLDGVEVIGGSLGTLIEFGHIMKINDARLRAGRAPKFLAPIVLLGTRTTVDSIYEYPYKPEQRVCFPDKKLEDGFSAAQFLAEKLGLE